MSVFVVNGVIILDGRTEGRNLVNSEGFNQIKWILYVRGLWHKVTIFDGWRYGKDNALKMIFSAIAPDELLPVMYHQDGIDAVFFVNDCGLAVRKLCMTNLKIFNPTGRKLVLQIELRHAMTTKICVRSILGKAITSNMYKAAEKILYLSKFHKDPELDKWLYCPLTLRKVSDEVLSVISNYLPTLKAIILSYNSLTSLQGLSYLAQYAPNLRIVDLQNNLLPEMSSLDSLRGLQLHELTLDGNPLCELYEDDSRYINEARAIFPTITKLDGVAIPPPGFLVSKANYMCNPDGETLAEQFVSHYYKLYDGWNGQRTRMNLIGTYHKEALFSLSAAPIPMGVSTPQHTGRLNKYFHESRNLLKMSDYIKSNKYLHHGRDNIVKFLSDLPLTEHDHTSIRVDMIHYGESFAVMVVQGVFRELDTTEVSLRSFNRVFALSRNNNTYSIVNDILFITNVTTEQSESSLSSFPPMPAKPCHENVVQPTLDDKNYEIKQNMVEELSKATEMNLRWSRKCLDETEWDFQEALIIFMELYKEGAIPPEAFKL